MTGKLTKYWKVDLRADEAKENLRLRNDVLAVDGKSACYTAAWVWVDDLREGWFLVARRMLGGKEEARLVVTKDVLD